MKAVFLDRDGVINKYPGDFKYVTNWKEFKFLPGIETALKKLNQSDFKIFIISNQAGISKGIYSQKTLDQITSNMLTELAKYEVKIDGVFYCTHLPKDNCDCRKPKTGLVKIAIEKVKNENEKIELSSSYFIGDSIRDIETGKSSGLKTILVFSGREKLENKGAWAAIPDYTADDLTNAVDIILKEKS